MMMPVLGAGVALDPDAGAIGVVLFFQMVSPAISKNSSCQKPTWQSG